VELLFNYLRDVIYDPANASLDIEKLPEDFQDFASGLQFFSECVMETKGVAQALSRGDLNAKMPSRGNEIASPLKSLHASLKHLTWQTQQIAQGDYNQRVAFMGDFSRAFNVMVEQLAEREIALKETINQMQIKSAALEQGNLLLTALMRYVPQQIIVLDRDTRKILLMNDIAMNEAHNNADYMKTLMQSMAGRNAVDNGGEVEITYKRGAHERYFMVKTYLIEWGNLSAEVFAVSDITATKNIIEELEVHAYQDGATQLYNRTFGMLTLDSWLHEKRQFVLIFADLDSLKYINDEFGHNEGDIYIKNAAKHLKTFSPTAVVCRIGGDEFMLLAPKVTYAEASLKMSNIYINFQNDSYLKDKPYSYSISFGIVAVERENKLSASDILSIADEKMYENKRMRKKERQQDVSHGGTAKIIRPNTAES